MSLVLDASVTLAWIFADEVTPTVTSVFNVVDDSGAWVPGIWRLEVANGLRQAMRKRRINESLRAQSLADLIDLNLRTDLETDIHAWDETLNLSDQFDLTPYDACYLELALRRSLPLATLNGDLRKAAKGLGIELLGV